MLTNSKPKHLSNPCITSADPVCIFSGQVICTNSPLYYQISGTIANSVHFWETYIKMSSGALTERGRSNP